MISGSNEQLQQELEYTNYTNFFSKICVSFQE